MDTLSEAYTRALSYHEAGQVQDAEPIYRQILAVDANHADSWHLLGEIAIRRKQYDVAIEHITRAIELNRWFAPFYSNLGVAYERGGRLDEAITCYRYAIQVDPSFAAAHHNLGVVLAAKGSADEAMACYRTALEIDPGYAEAHHSVGVILLDQKKHAEAIASLQEAIRLQPSLAAAHCNLGNAFLGLGRMAEALASYREATRLQPDDPGFAGARNNMGIACLHQGHLEDAVANYREAIRLNPDFAAAYKNLGEALREQKHLEEAVASLNQAIRLQPDYAEAHHHLGITLREQGKLEEAAVSFGHALRLKPTFAEAHNSVGRTLEEQQRFPEALASYQRAIDFRPAYAEAHRNRSLVHLVTEDFEKGWTEYEWRWRCPDMKPRDFSQPRWEGSPLDGRAVLLYAEQGFGDTIQFVRYAALVKKAGGRVIVECPEELSSLLPSCPGVDQLVIRGATLPPFDFQAPLLSLPRVFQTNLATIPADVPYLFPDPTLVENWRDIVGGGAELKVGIAWQGRREHLKDARRSVPLARFEVLGRVANVHLFSLQEGEGAEQLAAVGETWKITELASRFRTFHDTAAAIKNLDLVITVDSAVAHCAGAVGVPVWVAIPSVPDWRWLLHREDSPWYPTMRLFRQKEHGDWTEVFDRMAVALEELLQAKNPSVVVDTAAGELIDQTTIPEIKNEPQSDAEALGHVPDESINQTAIPEIKNEPQSDAEAPGHVPDESTES